MASVNCVVDLIGGGGWESVLMEGKTTAAGFIASAVFTAIADSGAYDDFPVGHVYPFSVVVVVDGESGCCSAAGVKGGE